MCLAQPTCTAWVRQPSSNVCWMVTNTGKLAFKASKNRNAGLRCDKVADWYNSLFVVYRDFVKSGSTVTTSRGTSCSGHCDFDAWRMMRLGTRHGAVAQTLSTAANPKPYLSTKYSQNPKAYMLTNSNTFNQWYGDSTPGIRSKMIFEAVPGTSTYAIDDQRFFPLTGIGCKDADNRVHDENFYFTTEIIAAFHYTGGEKFDFRGDDDVYVFVNGFLEMDLGGVKPPTTGASPAGGGAAISAWFFFFCKLSRDYVGLVTCYSRNATKFGPG